jgi:hypothetical protein
VVTQAYLEGRSIRAANGCLEWHGQLDVYGYGKFRRHSKDKWHLAHRFSLMNSVQGPIRCALHRCGNRRCIEQSHLYDGTPADNVRDMEAAGTAVRDLRAAREATLVRTPELVALIRGYRSLGLFTLDVIAAGFGVSGSTVDRALRG